jgi:hypothetical protein
MIQANMEKERDELIREEKDLEENGMKGIQMEKSNNNDSNNEKQQQQQQLAEEGTTSTSGSKRRKRRWDTSVGPPSTTEMTDSAMISDNDSVTSNIVSKWDEDVSKSVVAINPVNVSDY